MRLGLLHYQPDIDESPFGNVLVVPPGSYVQMKCEGTILPPLRTWTPESLPMLELSSDTSYEEACLQEIESAVSDRLRVKGPVFCELSGGLDSSTIAVTADQILKKTGRDPASLTTTLVPMKHPVTPTRASSFPSSKSTAAGVVYGSKNNP